MCVKIGGCGGGHTRGQSRPGGDCRGDEERMWEPRSASAMAPLGSRQRTSASNLAASNSRLSAGLAVSQTPRRVSTDTDVVVCSARARPRAAVASSRSVRRSRIRLALLDAHLEPTLSSLSLLAEAVAQTRGTGNCLSPSPSALSSAGTNRSHRRVAGRQRVSCEVLHDEPANAFGCESNTVALCDGLSPKRQRRIGG